MTDTSDTSTETPATTPAPATTAAPAATATGGDDARARRKVRIGLVSSTKMNQTAVVLVVEKVRHPRYFKTVQRTQRLYVHDQNNELNVGDRVRVMETRPMSKLKRWRLVEILERAR